MSSLGEAAFFFFFLSQSFALVTQAGVQWRDLGSLQPPSSGFKQFSTSASQVARITGMCHQARLIFVFLSKDMVSPSWSGCFRTLDLIIQQSQLPKVLGLQA